MRDVAQRAISFHGHRVVSIAADVNILRAPIPEISPE